MFHFVFNLLFHGLALETFKHLWLFTQTFSSKQMRTSGFHKINVNPLCIWYTKQKHLNYNKTVITIEGYWITIEKTIIIINTWTLSLLVLFRSYSSHYFINTFIDDVCNKRQQHIEEESRRVNLSYSNFLSIFSE